MRDGRKQAKKLINRAVRQGWDLSYARRGGHYQLKHPNGTKLQIGHSPAPNTLIWFRNELQRHGVDVG